MEAGTKDKMDLSVTTLPFPDFLLGDPTEVAQRLLGCFIVREFSRGEKAVVRIVETESYDETDPASHAFGGVRARNAVMFGPSGHFYVYFTYGMHYCCNIVTGQTGTGSGVLIRAAEPIHGTELIEMYRGKTGTQVTNGPAKLCQALQIDRSFNGHDARQSPLRLFAGPPVPKDDIITTTRIGISKAKDEPRRFYIASSPYVSVRAANI